MIVVASHKMSRIPHLRAFLGDETAFWPGLLRRTLASPVTAVAGWGRRKTSARARAQAARSGLPFLAVEDGFLRSLDLGVRGARPLSLVVDKSGIYYDANRPSDLENLLNSTGWERPELLAEAREAMDAIRQHGLSKYNHAPDLALGFLDGLCGPREAVRRILVLDQTRGDLSIGLGLADEKTFAAMLDAAIAEHPGAAILIKTHPDVLAGRKKGYLAQDARRPGVTLLAQDVSPLSLLAQVDEVYTVSSQMGFEALMLGLPVHCFGVPFYAGWGLTRDRQACPRRARARSLEEVFAAAYMLYARYVNPVTGERCGIMETIRLLAGQRRQNEANRGFSACAGFSKWKQPHARAFLKSTQGQVRFFDSQEQAMEAARARQGRVVVWSSKEAAGLGQACAHAGVELVRIEDGFLRSVGLGSDFTWPLSLVLDRRGIYYAPDAPSDLEALLEQGAFDARVLGRARDLRHLLVNQGITKYNVPGQIEILNTLRVALAQAAGRAVVLVPGQVEDDASVVRGGGGIHGNLELLRAVRQARPEAFIVYKPHPDVLRGNRLGQVPEVEALRFADFVASGLGIGALYPLVREVHTLTSLSGFEALLRGLAVYTYGGPFYAGWGLTEDRLSFARRTRRLTLDQLVAGTLIAYPAYFDWRTGMFCGPEEACARLREPGASPRGGMRTRLAWAGRELLKRFSCWL